MKKIILLVLILSIISCSQNNLKRWVNYDQSSEIIENLENKIKDFDTKESKAYQTIKMTL